MSTDAEPETLIESSTVLSEVISKTASSASAIFLSLNVTGLSSSELNPEDDITARPSPILSVRSPATEDLFVPSIVCVSYPANSSTSLGYDIPIAAVLCPLIFLSTTSSVTSPVSLSYAVSSSTVGSSAANDENVTPENTDKTMTNDIRNDNTRPGFIAKYLRKT